MNTAQAESTTCTERESQGTLEYRTHGFCWGWQSFGALIGVLGGIVTALIGSVFTAISWIMGAVGNGAYMQTLGTDFLLLTIPLLVLGAHCLDVVEKRTKTERNSEINEDR